MSGLGNMAGLGASLPDRNGGGKKKGGKGKGGKKGADPEEESEGEDDPDFAEGVDQKEVMKALSQLQGNAGLVSALQQKLDGLVGMSSGFVEGLHYKVRARVEELGNLQESHDELYEKFLEEKNELESKYRALYQPLYNKRSAIVKGEGVDPAADATPEEGEEDDGEEVPAGIPDFWLLALKNHEMIEEQITERDEPALKHLIDVTSSPLEGEQKGFTLDFHFEQPNPFFSNAVITKTYNMIDDEDPILENAEGTEIQWLPGKNLTVKVLRKKPKSGAKNAKPITKTEQCESFFNFFYPPAVPEEDEDLTEEEAEQLQDAMETDYEMGAIIKEKIIPDAVSWFTGEANEEESDDEDYDDDEEDDEDDDDESVDDEDDDSEDDEKDDEDSNEEKAAPAKGKGKGKGGFKGPPGAEGADGEKPPECKQQ